MLRRLVFVLLLGACKTAVSPADAGVDEPVVDAGALDAGAEEDAGVVDAGLLEFDAGFSLLLPLCGVQQGQTAPGFALLDTGQSLGIQCLQKSASAVVSVDGPGLWVLWRSADGARLASGFTRTGEDSQLGDCARASLSLKGDTLAVVEPGSNRVQVRSAVTGLVTATLPMGTRAGVSTDGSAVWVSSGQALEVYSPSGTLLLREAGDFSTAAVFARPGQLRVIRGTTLERLDVPGGARTMLASISGSFRGWFHDGSHFFTRLGTTVWVVSADGVVRTVMNLPEANGGGLEGQRDWFWNRFPAGMPTSFFRLDAGQNPVTTRTIPFGTYTHAGDSLGLLSHGSTSFEVLRLGESTLTSTTFTAPVSYLTAFAANDEGEWVIGSDSIWNAQPDGGVVSLGCGTPVSVTGAETGLMAVATGSGQVLLVDLRPDGGHTVRPPIDFFSGHVELSADGRHLAAAGLLTRAQYWNDRSLRVYDLADGGLAHVWPYAWADYPTLFLDFTFAREGNHLSHLKTTVGGPMQTWSSLLTDRAGAVIATATSTEQPMLLAPDGKHGAQPMAEPVPGATTTLFSDGALSGAVMGRAVGWLSNDRLLLNVYRRTPGAFIDVFDHAELRDPQGTLVQMSPLPELRRITMVTPSIVYDAFTNATYDVATGQRQWQSRSRPPPSLYGPPLAAPAGDFAVFVNGSVISAEPR